MQADHGGEWPVAFWFVDHRPHSAAATWNFDGFGIGCQRQIGERAGKGDEQDAYKRHNGKIRISTRIARAQGAIKAISGHRGWLSPVPANNYVASNPAAILLSRSGGLKCSTATIARHPWRERPRSNIS